MAPDDIAHDIRRVLTRMKMKIESAEMHLKNGTAPLAVSFTLWSEIRKWEATLKAHDPKPNDQTLATGGAGVRPIEAKQPKKND